MPGHTFLFAPDRIERNATGKLLVIGEAVGGIGNSGAAIVLEDSAWVAAWELGTPTTFIEPVDAPDLRKVLVWRTTEGLGPNRDQSYLVVSELAGSSLAFEDSVVLLAGGLNPYAAAASSRRLWAAGHDRTPPTYVHNTRFFYSETTGVWRETPFTLREGDAGVSMLVHDDTTLTVALASGGSPELRLGFLRGTRWENTTPVPSHGYLVLDPVLRHRRSGGYWLAWATQDSVIALSTWKGAGWEPTRFLRFEHSHPSHHHTNGLYIGDDPNEYPVMAWSAYSSRTGLGRIFVCTPADTGFTVAEEIAGSEEGIPVVLRDENGDVWLAWYRYFSAGMFWQHTYVTATATDLMIHGNAGARRLTWNLTEAAPKSRWAVLRSRNGGPSELAAHVLAGEALTLSWTDSSPLGGVLRYKLRRECLDVRYQWESPEVQWPLRSQRPIRFTAVATPLTPGQTVELSGAAAGPLVLGLYDIQGRKVFERRWEASGSGIDRIPFDAGRPVGSGVYFLRAVDAGGSASEPRRIVLLR